MGAGQHVSGNLALVFCSAVHYSEQSRTASSAMEKETAKLTIRLPKQDLAFVKDYAQRHGLTVTEIFDRYLRRMRALESHEPRPELDEISGILPSDIDLEKEFRRHQVEKHRP